jgi:hypothetical protein
MKILTLSDAHIGEPSSLLNPSWLMESFTRLNPDQLRKYLLRAGMFQSALDQRIKDHDLVVINGDLIHTQIKDRAGVTYDENAPVIQQAYKNIDAGVAWLERQLQANPEKPFVYVAGNQDLVFMGDKKYAKKDAPSFMQHLHNLEKKYPQFKVAYSSLLVGDTLILHGDPVWRDTTDADYQGRMNKSDNKTSWNENKAPYLVEKLEERAFGQGEPLKVTIWPDFSERTLNFQDYRKIKNIFAAHTHVPIYNQIINGKHYYNTGSLYEQNFDVDKQMSGENKPNIGRRQPKFHLLSSEIIDNVMQRIETLPMTFLSHVISEGKRKPAPFL